ncbi:MAG: 4Fe-4S dicluster domain-containing protein [Defluviitaleaceae bacterium]|nr:4Fe-4S dicluster domain-containing protein [Defluviitaleaceae bacterium]
MKPKTFKDRHLKTRPKANIGLCNGCGTCKTGCPEGAIEMYAYIPPVVLPPKTGEPRFRPEIDYTKCKHCYHCQKQCPRSAVENFKPWLMRKLGR